MTEPIILRTYGNVWQMEKTIYHIGGKKLIIPVPTRQAAYFAAAAVGMFILSVFLPFIKSMGWMIQYIIIPYLISSALNKKLLDGRTPVSYLQSLYEYQSSSKRFNRYKPVVITDKKMLYQTLISFRETVNSPSDDMQAYKIEFI